MQMKYMYMEAYIFMNHLKPKPWKVEVHTFMKNGFVCKLSVLKSHAKAFQRET